MRVLIAYDGSEHADAALDDVRHAGLHDVDALVLSVEEVWLPPPAMLPPAGLSEGGRAALAAHCEAALGRSRHVAECAAERLRTWFPHWRVQAEGAAGSPLEAIVTRAEAWLADLVLLGAHGRSAAPRLWPGSVTLGVLRHVPCSTRVGRCGSRGLVGPLRLMVAVDGSANGDAMLKHVRSRSWAPSTQVRVVTIVDSRLAQLVLPGLSLGPTSEAWAHDVANRAVTLLRETGPDAAAWVEHGDPRHVLLNAAQSWPADCLFVGARGLGRLPCVRMGSVSTAVALRASCTVEVVRNGVD